MPLESPEGCNPLETNEREHACMAKKHAPDRKPYSPVDAALMRSLPTIFGSSTGAAEPNHEEAVHRCTKRRWFPAPPTAVWTAGAHPPGLYGVSPSATRPPALSIASDAQARPKASSPERLTKYLKFQVSHTEQMDIVRIVHHFAGELGTSLDWSHVARALMLALPPCRARDPQICPTSWTINAAPELHAVALAEFEHAIAQILMKALQEADILR